MISSANRKNGKPWKVIHTSCSYVVRAIHKKPKEQHSEWKSHWKGVIINIRKKDQTGKSQNKLIGMLEELLSKDNSHTKKRRLEEDYGIKMSVEAERRGQDMCNLSELVWEEGMEQGRARAISDAIQKIVKKLDVTEEQAMDILEVPKEEREKFEKEM